MGWSISPSSSIARIDAASGQATFGHHDNDKTYTIAYTSEETGTITHQFTVYGCTPPAPPTTCDDVSVQGFSINCEEKTKVRVGSYDGYSSVVGVSSNDDWITSLTTEGGYVYGNVTKNDGNERTAIISITGITSTGACTKQFTFKQKECGSSGCDCETAHFSVTGKTIGGGGNVNVIVADYTAECDDNAEVRFVEGDNFLQSPFLSNGTIISSKITAYEGIRTSTYAIYIGETKCTQFTVTQNGSGVCNCAALNVDSEVTFGQDGGIKKVGSISSDCELKVYGTSDWCKLYQEGSDIKVSATTNTSANSRHTGFGYKVGDGSVNCGDIAVHQNGGGTTYNIVLSPTYGMGVSSVKFFIKYEKSGGTHIPFITNGMINVSFWNCNGGTEMINVPDGNEYPLCEQGSGATGRVNKQNPSISFNKISCYITIGGKTESIESGESTDITIGDITYHITCQ